MRLIHTPCKSDLVCVLQSAKFKIDDFGIARSGLGYVLTARVLSVITSEKESHSNFCSKCKKSNVPSKEISITCYKCGNIVSLDNVFEPGGGSGTPMCHSCASVVSQRIGTVMRKVSLNI